MAIRRAVAAFVLMVAPGVAAPSCTPWMDQGDGTSWRSCVNDDGTTHCYRISNKPGSTEYEVACK